MNEHTSKYRTEYLPHACYMPEPVNRKEMLPFIHVIQPGLQLVFARSIG